MTEGHRTWVWNRRKTSRSHDVLSGGATLGKAVSSYSESLCSDISWIPPSSLQVLKCMTCPSARWVTERRQRLSQHVTLVGILFNVPAHKAGLVLTGAGSKSNLKPGRNGQHRKLLRPSSSVFTLVQLLQLIHDPIVRRVAGFPCAALVSGRMPHPSCRRPCWPKEHRP